MKCKTLINLVDEFNYHNVVAILSTNPDKIVFVYRDCESDINDYEIIRDFVAKRLPNVLIKDYKIDELDDKMMTFILSKYKDENTILNLSGGTKLMSLNSYITSIKCGVKSIFIDIENNKILRLENNGIIDGDSIKDDLNVEDFIACSGGRVINDNTEFYNQAKIKLLINYIVKNYKTWIELKYILTNNYIVEHNQNYDDSVNINISWMNPRKYKIYLDFINFLRTSNVVEVININKYTSILKFTNKDYKNFIFKTGCWLEAFTQTIVKEIKDIDDVKSGILFVWDDDNKYIRNEMDVIASSDLKLICISCKDTSKYDEDDLNELEVYSNKIGGYNSIKILIATQKPEKNTILSRAEEMEIQIIIFDGDEYKFRNQLSKVILDSQ